MTLIIYDNQGQIFSQITGSYLIPNGGIQYLEIEIPQGKILKGVDVTVTPHQPILEDIPPSEVDLLKQQVNDLNIAMANLMGV